MNPQPPGGPPQGPHRFDVAIVVAIIALVGTITAAIITATATITAASSKNPVPVTVTATATPTGGMDPSSTGASTLAGTTTTQTSAPTSTTPITPDGVTYRCVGSAPAGVEITYGPSGTELLATALPFTKHDSSVSEATASYGLGVQLKGGGNVTCMVTVTDGGKTATSSGTARGGYSEAFAQLCFEGAGEWQNCN